MPSLKKLLIRDTSIVSADLQWLKGIDSLDHLEILYSPIDDKAVAILEGLSVWKSMRIFGTNISYEAGEGLVKRLDGIEVQFGCGGFLGIQSDVQAARTSTVSETTPNGAAERAGIVSGDIITKIEDEPITTFEDIRASLRKRRPGEKVVVELERTTLNGQMDILQVNVVLGRQE
jgi:membrane-associated protease RseP (regulator of RpoE activity)